MISEVFVIHGNEDLSGGTSLKPQNDLTNCEEFLSFCILFIVTSLEK